MIDVDPDLLHFLKEEEVRSRNEDLLERAETSLNSYNGDYYNDEVDGRSKVVTRDVSEVIDHMNVSVLRTFVSGDRVVEFEPMTQDQEQAADDATEAVQRQFQRKGYQLLHDWLKEGNINVLGIVKTAVEMKKRKVEHEVPNMLLDQLDNVTGAEPVENDDSGMELMRVSMVEESPAEFKDYLVPLEEFRVSPDARDVDDAAYVAHAVIKTLSDLIQMGFDPDEVEACQSMNAPQRLGMSRSAVDEAQYRQRHGQLRQVLLMEEYVRYDADGDGIAERLCVHRVGDTVLRIEECDYQPFVVYCPFPMPGRLAGHSLAEKVNDIQRINTVLNRLALDGLYCNLASGYLVGDNAVNENTYDDILTVRPNRVIRSKDINQIRAEEKNDVSGVAFNAMEFMIGQRESRTGITRLNQGLDADSLNKTATGTALMQAQGQQMEEYLARNFGEALARLMRLKLKLMSRYGAPMQMRVDGEYREADPQQWPEDMDVVIRVGLGSGRKDQRLQNRMTLLQIQRECMMAGLPIVAEEQIYKSIAGVVRDASLGSPADFVIDPSSKEYQETQANKPPHVDPEQQKVQAEIGLKQQAHESDMQLKGADLQGKQAEGAQKLELEREKATEAAQLARDKAAFEREQAMEQMMFERQMSADRFAHERELAFYKADKDAEAKKYRDGGDLSK